MKYIAVICFSLLFVACGSDDSSESSKIFLPKKTDYPEGEKVYNSTCIACHQKDGKGLEGSFPPLANSDYLLADKFRAIDIAANGMEGEIVVNGNTYNSLMAPQGLSKEEIKNVVNYVLNTWGNSGGEVTDEDVNSVLK